MAENGLKPLWGNAPVPTPDLGGASVTSRGSDPLFDTGGSSGLQGSPWESPPVSPLGGEETSNSVSGLPSLPNRFEPSGTPPGPPSLDDRSPGTIDEK